MGVLNKTSGQMEVYDAELFKLQPLFSGRSQARLVKMPHALVLLGEVVCVLICEHIL